MELTKSIEILSDAVYGHSLTLDQDFYDAVKLGIEALDYLIRERRSNPGIAFTVLKGETPSEKET